VIFKPHPTSARTTIGPLRRRCEEFGLDFVLADVPLLAEIVVAATRPELVVSCFSTGLATAKGLYGCHTAAVGTQRLLAELAPYQNSNRIPLTIIDALHSGRYELPGHSTGTGAGGAAMMATGPKASGATGSKGSGATDGPRDLNGLIDAVTYCMQPDSAAHLRGSAIDFLRLGGRRAGDAVLQTQTPDRARPPGTGAAAAAPQDPERCQAASDLAGETHPTGPEELRHHHRCIEAEEEWLSCR
jgi:hypothetical protein